MNHHCPRGVCDGIRGKRRHAPAVDAVDRMQDHTPSGRSRSTVVVAQAHASSAMITTARVERQQ